MLKRARNAGVDEGLYSDVLSSLTVICGVDDDDGSGGGGVGLLNGLANRLRLAFLDKMRAR